MDLTSRMLMMGSAPQRSWDVVGVGGLQSGGTVNYPATTQAGDVLVFLANPLSDPNFAPAGFASWDASTNYSMAYRIAGAGETSTTISSYFSSFYVIQFRPIGGAATKTGSSTGASITYTSLPSLLIAHGGAGTGSGSVSLPGSPVAAYGADNNWLDKYSVLTSGSSTGSMDTGCALNKFLLFHLV